MRKKKMFNLLQYVQNAAGLRDLVVTVNASRFFGNIIDDKASGVVEKLQLIWPLYSLGSHYTIIQGQERCRQ
jgi:hypothetical protein